MIGNLQVTYAEALTLKLPSYLNVCALFIHATPDTRCLWMRWLWLKPILSQRTPGVPAPQSIIKSDYFSQDDFQHGNLPVGSRIQPWPLVTLLNCCGTACRHAEQILLCSFSTLHVSNMAGSDENVKLSSPIDCCHHVDVKCWAKMTIDAWLRDVWCGSQTNFSDQLLALEL